jgi:hypothetical protein
VSSSVEGRRLSRVLQGSLRKRWCYSCVAIDESSVAEYSPVSNDVRAKVEESLLEAIARERLLKTQQAGKRLGECNGDL